jgi:hypothetical protein
MIFRVIETVSGSVAIQVGDEARTLLGSHDVMIWEGEAVTRKQALRKAAEADPRLDVKWMRIRHEDEMGQ